MQERMTLDGSRRAAPPDASRIASVDPHDRIEATIVIKRRSEPKLGGRIARADFAAAHGAHPDDINVVTRFVHEAGLTVIASHPDRRTVRIAGPAEAVKAAFGTQLSLYETPRGRFRGRVGALTLPADVASVVDAVLGLDNRPIAKPHIRTHADPHAAAKALRPTDVAKAYRFPTTADGTGQTIGIIELGGGFRQSDLDTYFRSLGIQKPQVSALGVLDGTNNPGVDTNSDGEVMLDIEVAGAVAPGASIVVYFAPNTDQGFHDALTTAVHDTQHNPSVISISWGAAESNWTRQASNAMNAALQDAAALGVTVTVAAGDDGSTDGVSDGADHVDFPASSPFALACGGTRLELTSSGDIAREIVWNDLPRGGATGGGFSRLFQLPAYQHGSNAANGGNTMRGVPDVAGNADPVTGYRVLVDGSPEVIGGTSAVAPLFAGLIALINELSGTPLGFWTPVLYANPGKLHDITEGNNGTFAASRGWDANTGLGTPDGSQLSPAHAKVATT
jgi:kumamolisin